MSSPQFLVGSLIPFVPAFILSHLSCQDGNTTTPGQTPSHLRSFQVIYYQTGCSKPYAYLLYVALEQEKEDEEIP